MKTTHPIFSAISKKRGALGPTQLIAIILILTAIGIGAWYYQQSKATTPPKPPIKGAVFPADEALNAATRSTNNIVFGGPPVTASSTKLIMLKNIAYYCGYSDDRRNPLWVAYRLDATHSGEKLKRPKGFKMDIRTLSRIEPDVYSKSGYDRGHMAPNSAIATRYGRDAQLETFLMSNIVPQSPELNRKVWQRLEKLEDEYASRYDTIWVITGPVFDEHIQQIDKHVEIPDAFYKIIFDEEKGNLRPPMAFLIHQTVTGKEYLDHFLTSIDEIEKLTGLDFIAPLNDEVENRLEAITPNRLW
ncbi:MAG: DNA/RNA non-specific endonuclease [Erysipelotrichia bacterium]|nr:DNA/RNA non-specific endonuclease [Erysipelotrichia bacterium]